MPDTGKKHKYMKLARKIKEVQLLTLSGELVDSCAARETLASLDFSDRLVHRDIGIFLVEALVVLSDFTASSVYCTEGSSVTTSSVEGGAAISLFGSSSSLKAFYNPRGRKQIQ
jgi:hypothetical protein